MFMSSWLILLWKILYSTVSLNIGCVRGTMCSWERERKNKELDIQIGLKQDEKLNSLANIVLFRIIFYFWMEYVERKIPHTLFHSDRIIWIFDKKELKTWLMEKRRTRHKKKHQILLLSILLWSFKLLFFSILLCFVASKKLNE